MTTTPPPWAARFRSMRRLTVLRVADVTPHMRRITLGGPEMTDLPEGPNVRLLFPPVHGAPLVLPLADAEGKAVWPEEHRPIARTYTSRRHDRAAGEIDVDFVLHGDEGVASGWAHRARPGDEIGLAGPAGRLLSPADWYLLVADMTGLPAVGRMLDAMAEDARGVVLVEIPEESERQDLRCPAGVEIRWLIGDGSTDQLLDAAIALDWPANSFVWAGAETGVARALRTHAQEVRGLEKRSTLIVGYWKRGMSESEWIAQAMRDHEAAKAAEKAAAAARPELAKVD